MAGEGGNIIRNVFGKSYKEAEQIMKDASKGALDFKSPQENTFYGKNGGKKLDEYEAKKDNTLLVTKVEGPFDDNGGKISKPKEGEKHWFKATFNRSAAKNEYKKLLWQLKINGIPIPFFFDYSSIEGSTQTIQVKLPCYDMRAYAYFKTPIDKVSVEVKIDNPLPVYIDRFKVKGKDRQGVNLADDLCYGLGVSNQYPSRYTLQDVESKGIWIKAEIRDKTDEELWTGFKRMVTDLFSVGELETVALDMIEKFKRNEGGEYTNLVLTKNVQDHPSSKRFCISMEDEIAERIKKSRGNISSIEDDEIHFTDNEIGKFGNRGWGHPQFSTLKDTFLGGLTICMNDTWAYEVKLTKFTKSGNGSYDATYKVTLYDHFGLDMPDIEKKYYYLLGFRYWFILQHIRGYKPFITKVEFEKTFKESISIGKAERQGKRRAEKEREDHLRNMGRRRPGEY
ncbi:DUF3289 family protein [Chryseobacterium sp.]|uniref:DUF3289 family protein n=1 Tax=Chryseobacterium sp. TaxID=1871047 RepID=UPI000ECDD2F5|nr:DUF3289 family protein [Chryseobacterium sp.]HCA05644.1 hypothetical protein [Chryseobacterium sp.]